MENPQDITIRTLAPNEWELYRAIRLNALQQEPQAFASRYEENRERPNAYWRERLTDAEAGVSSWMLFATSASIPVGMAGGYMPEPGVVEVISVYVSPEHRGRGIARRLMEELLCRLGESSVVKSIRLSVNKDQVSAVRLYSSLGFIMTGECSAIMGNGEVCEEYMMTYG